MPSLKHTIESLAKTFAAQVLTIIRSSSLEEILGQSVSTPTTTRAAKAAKAPRAAKAPKTGKRRGRLGRLPRRNADQIGAQLGAVAALLKKNPKGLRSEEIRAALELDRREIPRVLAEGLKSKALRKSGAKRATTYRAN